MRVIVNGEGVEVAAARVSDLLRELDYEGMHLAVAVNQRVVARGSWAETTLSGGDRVEILTPRQGG
jgi:sulfur carrier protein